MRALKIRSIEPLFESEPLGLIWSANEIEDFRNHINDLLLLYGRRRTIRNLKLWTEVDGLTDGRDSQMSRKSVRGVLISTLFTIDQIHMAYKCYIIY